MLGPPRLPVTSTGSLRDPLRIGLHLWRALALAVCLGLPGLTMLLGGCGGEANAICNKIYDDCTGALVDEKGASISREACIRLIEERAARDAQQTQAIADCVAQSSCEALPACFSGS